MARNATVGMARSLRRRAPASERDFWKLLRHRRLDGLKFRRQFPIGPYVVDFLCMRHRLIVELDGPFHDAAHDAERDTFLRGKASGFSASGTSTPAATSTRLSTGFWPRLAPRH
jgi:very-short-patch-repair endonuclease